MFSGFTDKDFDVFAIPGLEPRMEALRAQIRPKLEAIAEAAIPLLEQTIGEPFYVHVAKHARRTVNPPDETWVAWSTNKRGYKAYPHFQVGLRQSHAFIMLAMIEECKSKSAFARGLLKQLDEVWPTVPDGFVISEDHTQPETKAKNELGLDGIRRVLERLEKVKKAEFLCGVLLNRRDPVVQDGQAFLRSVQTTFERLLPLYRLAETAGH
ncbi:YktB family protein [Polycladomyces subterraneus]